MDIQKLALVYDLHKVVIYIYLETFKQNWAKPTIKWITGL